MLLVLKLLYGLWPVHLADLLGGVKCATRVPCIHLLCVAHLNVITGGLATALLTHLFKALLWLEKEILTCSELLELCLA